MKLGKKAAYLRYDDKTRRIANRRVYEQTREFTDRFRWRAGIEGTNSHLKSDVGAGRLRVRGIASVRFAVVLKALGLNILRCDKALQANLCHYFTQIYVLKHYCDLYKQTLRYLPYFVVKEQIYLRIQTIDFLPYYQH